MSSYDPYTRFEYLNGTRNYVSYTKTGAIASKTEQDILVGYLLQTRDRVRQGDMKTYLPYYIGEVRAIPGVYTKSSYSKYWDFVSQTYKSYLQSELSESYHNYQSVGPVSWRLTRGGSISIPCVAEANAVNEALDGLNRRRIDAAMIVAEIMKTSSHLAETLVTALRALLDLKHGRFSRALARLGITREGLSSVREPAARWLEYRYAVAPLLMDVAAATTLVQEQLSDLGYDSFAEKGKVRNSISDRYVSGGWDYSISGESTHITSIAASVDSAELVGLKALSSIDIKTVAWEATPWSFVIDQFLPIGTYLNAMQGSAGLSPLGYYHSQFTDYEVQMAKTAVVPEPDGSGPFYNSSWNCSTKVRVYKRVVNGGFPAAQLPTFENPFDARNVVTALALLRSLT